MHLISDTISLFPITLLTYVNFVTAQAFLRLKSQDEHLTVS